MKTKDELLIENIFGVVRDWNEGASGDVDALMPIVDLFANDGYEVGQISYDDFEDFDDDRADDPDNFYVVFNEDDAL